MSQNVETVRLMQNRRFKASSRFADVPAQKRKEDAKQTLYLNRI